jgi:hypothetical protein
VIKFKEAQDSVGEKEHVKLPNKLGSFRSRRQPFISENDRVPPMPSTYISNGVLRRGDTNSYTWVVDSDYDPGSDVESDDDQMDDYPDEYVEEAGGDCVGTPVVNRAAGARDDRAKKSNAGRVKQLHAGRAQKSETDSPTNAEDRATVYLADGAENAIRAPVNGNADVEHAGDESEGGYAHAETTLKKSGVDHTIVTLAKSEKASTRKRRIAVNGKDFYFVVKYDMKCHSHSRVILGALLDSGSELTALAPLEKRYRPSKWSKERESMAASHENISVTTNSFVSNHSWPTGRASSWISTGISNPTTWSTESATMFLR